MNTLLDLRIHSYHPRIQIRMLRHQHLRIPRCGYKHGITPAPNGCHEDLAHLQADQKRKRHHHGCVTARAVVRRLGELQIQIRQQRAEIRDKRTPHRQNRPDQAVVHQRVDPAVLHHLPRILRGGDVRFAVERDVREGVAIDELHRPVEEGDDALEAAEREGGDDVALLRFLLLCNGDALPDHVDECDDERAERNTAERVGH